MSCGCERASKAFRGSKEEFVEGAVHGVCQKGRVRRFPRLIACLRQK